MTGVNASFPLSNLLTVLGWIDAAAANLIQVTALP
jgi:hypothetical protein